MELLVFGHGGLPTIVFPTSCGRFYEFEERGMVAAVQGAIERGELQLICVDSVDAESWYNRDVPPRWRIARQLQYESYVMEEVVPLVRALGNWGQLATAGASFGGFHAANFALRHPDVFRGFLSMGAAFDLSNFFRGYYDQDVYLNIPAHYVPGLHDPWFLDRYRQNTFVLVAGEWDICRGQTERMAQILRDKGIPVRFDLWGNHSMHDWPEWRKMVAVYL
jgi:esterase/lipase superfamily enzyme